MNWWRDHGTKIIGGVMGGIGVVLTTLTPQQIADLFGPKAAGIAVLLGAATTVYRGFQNSGTLPGGPKE